MSSAPVRSVDASARQAGRISEWHDDKGYGFVVPHDGGARAFVHIRAFQVSSRRPVQGDLISYALGTGAKGRVNAVDVRFAGQRVAQPPKRVRLEPRRVSRPVSRPVPRMALGVIALVAVVVAAALGLVPVIVALLYLAMSVVSYLAYWRDKDAAGARQWRVQEETLHGLDLLGGWPGALIAQQQFRHKTVKASFQAAFWITVVLNIAGIVWLARQGWAQVLTDTLLDV
jgi:uncharacterized membrane protein YsdA (DUF1294 family)/cold shock CspA family protein